MLAQQERLAWRRAGALSSQSLQVNTAVLAAAAEGELPVARSEASRRVRSADTALSGVRLAGFPSHMGSMSGRQKLGEYAAVSEEKDRKFQRLRKSTHGSVSGTKLRSGRPPRST